MSATIRSVPIRPVSDGDPSHRPARSNYSPADAATYLEKLALWWMTDRGEARPGERRTGFQIRTTMHVLACAPATKLTLASGIRYRLDRLPTGYAVFQKPRIADPKHVSGSP